VDCPAVLDIFNDTEACTEYYRVNTAYIEIYYEQLNFETLRETAGYTAYAAFPGSGERTLSKGGPNRTRSPSQLLCSHGNICYMLSDFVNAPVLHQKAEHAEQGREIGVSDEMLL
ncbi:hypothetical protein ANCDUO_14181, partial [Ancylostoma duodenale]